MVLKGKARHELACQNCGAPIHVMKRLALEPAKTKQAPRDTPVKAAISHRPEPKSFKKPKKKKRRKSKLRWFVKEAFEKAKDALEDIFD